MPPIEMAEYYTETCTIPALLFPQNLPILVLVVLALPIFLLSKLMDPKYLEVC